MVPAQGARLPEIEAGDPGRFLTIVKVLAVLVPQELFEVTLNVPLAVKFGVYVMEIEAVPWPLKILAPTGATQL